MATITTGKNCRSPNIRGTPASWRSLRSLAMVAGLVCLIAMGGWAPAFADCTDVDGDGYGNPASTDCTYPQFDCDDTNSAINPGATEKCNGVDDDCDTDIDEGFGVGDECAKFHDPPGCAYGDPGGCCLSGPGHLVCSADELGTVCDLDDPDSIARLQSDEPPVGDPSHPSCFDGSDNDCDGLTDHEESGCFTAEKCDGFDNDGDGSIDENWTDLGDPCYAGSGECERTGEIVCDPDDPLKLSTKCNVTEGDPVLEIGALCSDGLDNDCDGYTDGDDPDCCPPEVCDGLDNDCDGETDEDFANLGNTCDNGLSGECYKEGVYVCAADGSSTVCNASPGLPGTEGPSGATCSDGLDNDCDGYTDGDDPDCGSALLSAYCSLPYLRGHPGDDCTGWHEIYFGQSGGAAGTTVTAELLALDLDGKILDTTRVYNGNQVHMASRIDPSDYLFKSDKKGKRHWDFAPVPLLRVTADDGKGNKAHAFCSNIPYLERVAPSAGKVLSASEGDTIKVVAAIPRVDPATLFVKVDGVDVFTELGIDPATDFPGVHPGGDVKDNGDLLFTVSDLKVDVGAIGDEHSNTLTMNLSNLGCGGHIVVVDGDGQLGIITPDTTLECNHDDVKDTGTFSVFAIKIDTPTPGMVTSVVPTPVEGEVCHGREISSVMVNGKDLNVAGMAYNYTPPVGEDVAETHKYEFDTTLPQTDLAADIAGTNYELGTFDPGSNKLHALAEDDEGNRTVAMVNFAVGDVTAVPLSVADMAEIGGIVRSTVEREFGMTLASTEIQNAMVLGLEPEAIQTFFARTCAAASDSAKDKIIENLKGKWLPDKTIEEQCDPIVHTQITDVEILTDLTCSVSMVTDKLVVTLGVPDIKTYLHSTGHCCTGCDFICWVEITIDQYATATLVGGQLLFDVPEAVFLGTATVQEAQVVNGVVNVVMGTSNNDIGCIVGFFADLIDWIFDAFFFIFTFGQVDNPLDLSLDLSGVFKQVDLVDKIGVIKFPDEVEEIKINEQLVADKAKKLSATIEEVEITSTGFMASLKATFSPTSTDAEIENTPGALKSPADAPRPPTSPGDTFFVVSDDALNQLFASMTTQGEIKTMCVASGKCTDGSTCVEDSDCSGGTCTPRTVGDLLPADCGAIPGIALLPKVHGLCEGMKNTDCNMLSGPKVRGTCYGTQLANKADCETIQTGFLPGIEKQACRDTVYRNIFHNDAILFCGRADNPPYILIKDDVDPLGNPVTTPNQVETHLRMNDLLVGVVLDRDNTGAMVSAELNALPGCFQDNVDTTGDCKLIATCLDLNFPTILSLDTTDGKLKLVPTVLGVQSLPRDEGQTCEGGFNFGGDFNTLSESSSSSAIDDLEANIDSLTPALQSDGLDLGNVVVFKDPELFAIDTSGGIPGAESDFQDYLGIRGTIAEPPSP